MKQSHSLVNIAVALIAAVLLCACQQQITAEAIDISEASDNLEPGRQGEILRQDRGILPRPYSKGVRVVGHEPIRNRTGNLQLAWIDHCAYVSSTPPGLPGGLERYDPTSGLAVIDVSTPKQPKLIKLLRSNGSIQSAETLHAITAGDRKILIAGAYAGGNAMFDPDKPASLDIYDASDCTNPKLVAEYRWPENAHTVTISPDGLFVFGTYLGNTKEFSSHGGVMVLDISDIAHPKYLGRMIVTGPNGKSWEFAPHEISFNADGRRVYAAVTDSTGYDLNPGLKPGFSRERMSPDNGGIYILDNSDLIDGKPDPKLRLVGTAKHGGWHSVMPANINGVPYLVGGSELVGCPGAVPKIINIADETRPFIESEFRLEMNHKENCPPDWFGWMGTAGFVLSLRTPSATLHYNDVDNAENTRLGLFNFTAAGLRIADLRDPMNPVEIAYFRPGDMCSGHVRYIPETAQIWSVCLESGFWIIELKAEVRAALR